MNQGLPPDEHITGYWELSPAEQEAQAKRDAYQEGQRRMIEHAQQLHAIRRQWGIA